MPAYLISLVRRVHDREKLEAYWARSGATFEGVGSTAMSVYAAFEVLEDAEPLEGVVVIEFPSMQAARSWYHGDRYQSVRRLREGAADIDIVIVDAQVVSSLRDRMPHIV